MKVKRTTLVLLTLFCTLFLLIFITSNVIGKQGKQPIKFAINGRSYSSASLFYEVIAEIPVGKNPLGIDVNPITNKIYVANYADNSVSVIDGETNTVTATIFGVKEAPRAVGVNPTNNKIYVANGNHGSPVVVVDGETNTIIKEIPIAVNARGVAINQITNKVYVSTQTGVLYGTILEVIDSVSDTLIESIKYPYNDASGSGGAGVAVNMVTNNIYLQTNGYNVVIIDGFTHEIEDVLNNIDYSSGGEGIDCNLTTGYVYSAGNQSLSRPISVIDGTTNTLIEKIPIFPDSASPYDVAVDSINNRILVTSWRGSISIFDGKTNKFLAESINIGTTLTSIAFNSQTRRFYVVDSNLDKVIVLEEFGRFYLDLPIEYDGSKETFRRYLLDTDDGGRVDSWFDHNFPNGGKNSNIWTYDAKRTNLSKELNVGNCYDNRCYDGHNGLDFKRETTSDVIFAAAPGKVADKCANCSIGYGNYILIDHENGYATLYAHLSTITTGLEIGSRVNRGDPIGIMGNTGNTTGTTRTSGIHLHLTVLFDKNGDGSWSHKSEEVDPYGWKLGEADPWVLAGGPQSKYLWKYFETDTMIADINGGNFTSPTGSTKLTVPASALSSQKVIELQDTRPPAGPLVYLWKKVRSFWVKVFDPAPTLQTASSFPALETSSTFLENVTITMSYDSYDVLHVNENQLTIYHWDDGTSSWNALPTTVLKEQMQAFAQTRNSGYFDLAGPLLCPEDDGLEPDDDFYEARPLQVTQTLRFDNRMMRIGSTSRPIPHSITCLGPKI
jgi:YVTN family beta-propeller protein